MTQPGVPVPPQPGWWERVNKIGTAAPTFGWSVTAHGTTPSVLAPFKLAVTPTIGASAREVVTAAAGLALSASLGMSAAERYTRSFGLPLTPAMGMDAAGVSTAAFTVADTPALAMAAAGMSTAGVQLGLTPSLGMTGRNVAAAALGLTLTPSLGMSGTPAVVAVSYDSTGNGYTGTGTPSWTHLIGANANCVLAAVGVQAGATFGLTSVTATCGGTPMIPLGDTPGYVWTTGGYTFSVYVFGLLNPGSGSKTIAVSTGGGQATLIAANSVAYQSVGGFGNVVSNGVGSATSANPSQTITSAANQMIFQAISGYATNFSAYTKTQRYNASSSGSNDPLLIGDAAGAASVTMGCTAGSDYWGAVAVQLLPQAAAAGITYDFTGTGIQFGPSYTSWSHQIGSGANCLVVAATLNTTAALTSCTCKVGSTTVPLKGNTANYASGGFAYEYVFALMNPPTGLQTITLTFSGGGTVYPSANSASYKGVTALGTAVTKTGSTANPSHTVTAAAGNVVVWGLGGYISNPFTASAAAQRHNNAYISGYAVASFIGDAAGAASTVLTATAAADYWGSVALPLT